MRRRILARWYKSVLTTSQTKTRWRVLWALGSVALLAGFAIAARAFGAEVKVYRWQRHPVPPTEGLSGFSPAAIAVATVGTVRGWYWPSRNGVAVVLLHGSSSDRRSWAAEAQALAAAGFGVLAYDAPGHGESDGSVSWEDSDRSALRAAISWVLAKDGVRHVGVAGQSAGGVIAVQVSARLSEVEVLALIGTPGDLRALVHHEYGHWGWLSVGPALLALRLSGARIDVDRPIDLVGAFAPKPLLIVGGSDDAVVTPQMTAALRAAAGPSASLYDVTGATHGGWSEQGGQAYQQALVSFFSSAFHVE